MLVLAGGPYHWPATVAWLSTEVKWVLAGADEVATKLCVPSESTAVLCADAVPLPPQAEDCALPALLPIEWLLATAVVTPPRFVSWLTDCACAKAVTGPALAWVPIAVAVELADPGPEALKPPYELALDVAE